VRKILLVDDSASARHILAARLREQGYEVTDAPDAATAAELALANPPHAVVTDLWMPAISGLQLCRLLRAEAATSLVPIVLLTASDDRRSRFWARCAGATAYVTKTEIEELKRILAEVTKEGETYPPPAPVSRTEPGRVQERLSALLDTALYESTIAGEIRALAHTDGDLQRLFRELVRVASDVVSYRWLAVKTTSSDGESLVLLHANASTRAAAEEEARIALEANGDVSAWAIEDDRALTGARHGAPIVHPIKFGSLELGTIALGPNPRGASSEDRKLVELLSTELGGPLRMAALITEARYLAATDSLTGLMNRRAFMQAMDRERSRAVRHTLPLSLLMLDVDHFKRVNDTHGHDAGDAVLRGIAVVLMKIARKSDFVSRWGGEEFVVALAQTAEGGGRVAAERVRRAVAETPFTLPNGETIHATASVGLASATAQINLDELIARADRALYTAKARGRNRVEHG
jgi:two-component system, cell cycle response regulator